MTAGKKFNFGVLSKFNSEHYKDLIDFPHFKEEIVVGSDEDQIPFWLIQKNKQKYLFDHTEIAKIKMPFQITKTEAVYYRGKYFHHITGIKSLVFNNEKSYNLREIIDKIFNFTHSNSTDYLIYVLAVMASHMDRVNIRMISEAGFGKDGLFRILEGLCKDVNVTNPKSTAAIEYRLRNKVLVLADLSNLDKQQLNLMQDFLLLCGDMSSIYHKSTRGSKAHGTTDTYDITNLSLVVTHNQKSYYDETGQSYFGDIYTRAVKSRFLPLFFKGTIDLRQFKFDEPIIDVMLAHKQEYIRLIRTLKWYRQNFKKELKTYTTREYDFVHERMWQSFDRICQFINIYSNTQDEYNNLTDRLYECYRNAIFEEKKEGTGLDKYVVTEEKI